MSAPHPSLVVAVRAAAEVEEAILGGASVAETRDAGQLAALRQAARGRAEVMLRQDAPPGQAAALADRIALSLSAEDDAEKLLSSRVEAAGFTDAVIDLGEESGCVSRIGLPKLRRLTDACRARGLRVGFAGALEAPDVPRLRVLRPDALHLDRTARREDRLDRATIAGIADLLAAEPAAGGGPSDRIFVRDLVVEMELGAYGHEHARRQRVRFGVEVEVPRAEASAGMGGVYSYDLITDAVAMLAAGAHVDFVETLAEELAAMVLADPRVRSALIRVEKLDLGPGSVGIEIRRER